MTTVPRSLQILAIASFWLLAFSNNLFAQSSDVSIPVERSDCGAVRPSADLGGLLDYRLKDVDPRVQGGVAQVNQYHTEPARRMLSVAPTSRSIIADLDFSLRHSPNHAEALGLLVDYERGGGKSYDFPPLDCYFIWARVYAPNDIAVLQLAGLHYWRTGNLDMAELLYSKGLQLEPASAELNYNAGLFFYAKKDYPKARELAQKAYAAGYPLPGLRSMLQKVNQWTDASAAAPSGNKK